MDKDGKLDMWSREIFEILEEFGWNVEDMADAIKNLRKEVDAKDKKIFEMTLRPASWSVSDARKSLKNEIQ